MGDDTGGTYRGAVHVLFMNANGTVKSSQKIASRYRRRAGSCEMATTSASAWRRWAIWMATASATWPSARSGIDTGGTDRGAVHVLFMNANGTVKSSQKIASGTAAARCSPTAMSSAARSASLGDLDGDGVTDLAVGAYQDDTGGTGRGAVHVLFLNANGTVKSGREDRQRHRRRADAGELRQLRQCASLRSAIWMATA